MGGGRRCGERESNRGQLGGRRSREREMRQSDGEREGESWEGGEVERGRCGERERGRDGSGLELVAVEERF